MIENHLRGSISSRNGADDFIAGVYPLLVDETCWFLAADFDGNDWATDARAMLETCKAKSIPAALERSRSGDGGHLWIFFSGPVSARTARQLVLQLQIIADFPMCNGSGELMPPSP